MPNATILVIDQGSPDQWSTRAILKKFYKIFTAVDRWEAISCIEKNEVDLVTVNLKSPQNSNWETLAEIKRTDGEIGIIVITADADMETMKRIGRLGVNGLITDPFDPGEFISKVQAFLEKRRDFARTKKLLQKIDRIAQKKPSDLYLSSGSKKELREKYFSPG